MKKNTLLFLFFSVQFIYAQVDKISLEIENILLSRTEKPEDINSVKNFFENYGTAKPVQSEDLNRDLVGICFRSSIEKQFSLVPAKYSVDSPSENSGGIYFNLNPIEKSLEKENQEEYIKLFLENSPKIADNDYFRSLKYVDSEKKGKIEKVKDDMVIGDDDYLSLLKVKDKQIYAISFQISALDAKNLSKSEIRLYIFNQNLISSEDYMMIQMEKTRKKKYKKTQELKAIYPLYHDYRVDEIRSATRDLIKDPSYNADQTLVKYTTNLTEKLERTNIANYIDELKYFANLKIDQKYKDGFDEDIVNINHTSLHSLADIYLGKGEYETAEKYFKMALTEFPIFTVSGTTQEKDSHRIEYDLAKIYKKLNRKDEAYGYLIALMTSQWYYEIAEKEIMELSNDEEDKKKLKKDIDKAVKTFQIRKDDFMEFTFRGNKIVFWNGLFLKNLSNILNTDFYKSLK